MSVSGMFPPVVLIHLRTRWMLIKLPKESTVNYRNYQLTSNRHNLPRLRRHHGKPKLRLRWRDEFPVVLEKLFGRVAHFERYLLGGLNGGEAITRERVTQAVVNHLDFQGFKSLPEGAE